MLKKFGLFLVAVIKITKGVIDGNAKLEDAAELCGVLLSMQHLVKRYI